MNYTCYKQFYFLFFRAMETSAVIHLMGKLEYGDQSNYDEVQVLTSHTLLTGLTGTRYYAFI